VVTALLGAACSLIADPGELTGGLSPTAASDASEPTNEPSDSSPTGDDSPQIDSSPFDGEPPTDDAAPILPTTLAQDAPGATAISVSATGNVFWINASTHLVHSLPADGGAPPSYLPSDAGAAYVPRDLMQTPSGVVVFVPVTQPVEQSPCITYMIPSASLSATCGAYDEGSIYNAATVDPTSLYLLAEDCDGAHTTCLLRQTNSSTTYVDETVWKTPAGTFGPGPIAYDSITAKIFFFTMNGSLWSLRSIAASANTGTDTLITTDTSAIRAMGTDSTSVYWIDAAGKLKRSEKLPGDGGATDVLSSTFGNPNGLAIGEKYLFVTDKSDGSVHAVAKSGGVDLVLAKGESLPHGIALTPTGIVWANSGDGKIRSVSFTH